MTQYPSPNPPTLPPTTPPAGRPRHWLLFAAALTIIVADQLTKRYVEGWLPLNHSWAPWPEWADWFQFTHVANTGAAFGLFPTGSLIFTITAAIVGLIIILYNFSLPAGQRLLRLALGLQLGGALGNLIDRFRLGHVTDFFDFGPWPVFNIADAAIVGGVVILGYLMLTEKSEEAAAGAVLREPDTGHADGLPG